MKEQILAVQRMQDYIERNRTEEISLSDLALSLIHILRIEEDAETGEDVYATIDNEDELNAVFEEYLRIAEADE